MLFSIMAQQGGGESHSSNGVLYSVGATIIATLVGVVRYLWVRQEKSYTDQLNEVKSELAETKEHVRECQEDRDKIRAECGDLRVELAKVQTRCAIVERKVENGGGH